MNLDHNTTISLPFLDASSLAGYPEYYCSQKNELRAPFFMELIMLSTWVIWMIRNDFIFKGTTPNLYRCRKIFKEELALLVHKASRKSYSGLKDWVERFR
jgi:hypothetical protein